MLSVPAQAGPPVKLTALSGSGELRSNVKVVATPKQRATASLKLQRQASLLLCFFLRLNDLCDILLSWTPSYSSSQMNGHDPITGSLNGDGCGK